MKNLNCGLLDFGYRGPGLNSMLKLNDVINYALEGENLGFHRFWISEHHFATKTLAWSDPQVVLPVLANATKTIKIGAAGILMSLHTPYQIASYFKLLSNMFPKRIDLGLANGFPSSVACNYAIGLPNTDAVKLFEEKIKDLMYYLQEDEVLFEEGQGVVIPPYKGEIPEVWTLSSSAYRTADRAVNLKMNISRSIFHERNELEPHKERLDQFREDFEKKNGFSPKVNIVVGGIIHKTDKKARKIADDLKTPKDERNQHIIGSGTYCQERILQIQEDYGVNEVIFFNMAYNVQDRYAGLTEFSKALNLA